MNFIHILFNNVFPFFFLTLFLSRPLSCGSVCSSSLTLERDMSCLWSTEKMWKEPDPRCCWGELCKCDNNRMSIRKKVKFHRYWIGCRFYQAKSFLLEKLKAMMAAGAEWRATRRSFERNLNFLKILSSEIKMIRSFLPPTLFPLNERFVCDTVSDAPSLRCKLFSDIYTYGNGIFIDFSWFQMNKYSQCTWNDFYYVYINSVLF